MLQQVTLVVSTVMRAYLHATVYAVLLCSDKQQ
jgi:hypothetical protein